MKSPPIIALGLGLLALCCIPADGSGDSSKDRAKWRLATLSAAREILDELNQPKPLATEDRAILLEKLNTTMRENLQAHASRAKSRKACAAIAISMRRESIEQRFKEVTAHANELSPTPILWSDIASHLGAGWSNTMEKALQSFADTEMEPLFKDARNRALGLLRQEMEQRLRFPTETELNLMLGELLAGHPESLRLTEEDAKHLHQKITALINPGDSACLEELASVINDQTRRISTEVRKQYDHQRTLLESTANKGIPADRRQASVIEAFLITTIEAKLGGERSKAPSPDANTKVMTPYPLLEPLRKSIPGLASSLETRYLTDFIGNTPVLALQAAPLAGTIRDAPESHRTKPESVAVFTRSLAPALLEQAVTLYAAEANPAGRADYFKTLVSTNTALSDALQSRLNRELDVRLPEARRIVSEEQFANTFSDLEKPGPLSPATMESLQDSGGATLTNLNDALKLFNLSARGSHKLLEETVDRVLAGANRKAREGYDVLTAQLALVRKLEQDRLEKLRQDVSTKRPFKDIRAEWLLALEAAWTEDSRSRTTPYKELLDPTVASLNKTVRQLYDSVRENPTTQATPTSEAQPNTETEQGKIKDLRQDPAKTEDPKQDPQKDVQPPKPKTSPKAGGSEGASNTSLSRTKVDRRNEPDGILLLTGTGSGTAMICLMSQAGTTNCAASFDPRKPRESAESIDAAIKPQLKVMWDSTVANWKQEHSGFGILKRRTPPKLKLFIVIESDDVRHRMSLLLREHIEQSMQEWHQGSQKGTPEVELDWKVGLTLNPATQAE
jgi:hypothetical protein